MTAASGRKLDVGDRLKWSDGVLGTVVEIGYAAVKVQWDDGQWATLEFNDPTRPWSQVTYVIKGAS